MSMLTYKGDLDVALRYVTSNNVTTRTKHSKKGKRGTPRDTRSNGRWLWGAVLVGHNKECYTHLNGKKKFTFKILPPASRAPHGKPRGLVSIRQTLQKRIHKKSFVVFDKWTSSVSAVRELGYRHSPAINHSVCWRGMK